MRRIALAAVLLALAGPVAAQPLDGPWNAFNRAELEALIQTQGKDNPGYDSTRPPYAVFDWDNTSVFLDVEEATLAFQLCNLAFAATPMAMEKALANGLPQDAEITNLLDDISQSYSWLYLRHRAGAAVEELQNKPHALNFRAKTLYLYQLLEERYGREIAYTWMPQRFAGMTAFDVRAITGQAVRWQLKQPIEQVCWESPASLSGKAGVVTAAWSGGLRLQPEMQSLQRSLRKAGFHVWICTASFEEGIREVASAVEFGYGNVPERVLGLRLEVDAQGRYLPQRLADSDITYAQGKTKAIERQLVSSYGYGPCLVVGDSDGDADMLADFPDTRIGLIVDTLRSADSPIGALVQEARRLRGQSGARFLVQDRDAKTGRFLP